jgi:hypothetical protein
MSPCEACVVAFVLALESFCAPEECPDIPIAAWELPADATWPENRPGAGQLFGAQVWMSSVFSDEAATTDGPESLAEAKTPWKNVASTYNEQVAATVNGERILNGEVLNRSSVYAFNAQPKGFTLVTHAEQMDGAVARDLSEYIQRRLVIEEIASGLPIIEVEKLQLQSRALIKSRLAANRLEELNELSRDERTSVLQYVKRNLSTRFMADLLLAGWVKEHAVSEDELRDYYRVHSQDYTVPAQAEWEQIQISFFDDVSRMTVRSLMKKAQQELEKQTSTAAEVASKYSDGPTAKHGGQRKSMPDGSLNDLNLERMLFEMPVGEWSNIYEGPSELQLVRVQNRRPAKQLSFVELESQIRQKLTDERVEKLVKGLYDHAKIETRHEVPEFKCFYRQTVR